MKKQLNRYKFDKISNMMAKEFGKIERGKDVYKRQAEG